MKKAIIWFLIILVLVFTIIALLGIWEVIDLDRVVRKLLLSLVVIFASGAVILFIYSVMGKEIEATNKDDH
ncbi:MAG TPA: hypothetical protein ENK25_08075 [Bacteroidetes bacterium]|nr:hypothetical protein [Bacteroidota bacterium]